MRFNSILTGLGSGKCTDAEVQTRYRWMAWEERGKVFPEFE